MRPVSASSLSEKLCLRFSARVRWDEVVVVVAVVAVILRGVVLAAGCSSEGLAVESEVVEWAEITGEGEGGEFGVAGSAEAIRGGAIGVVSSARTTVGEGYGQMTQVFVGGSAVPLYAVVSGSGSYHEWMPVMVSRPSTMSTVESVWKAKRCGSTGMTAY